MVFVCIPGNEFSLVTDFVLQKLEVIILEVCYTGMFEHTDGDIHTCMHMQDTHTQYTHTTCMHAFCCVPSCMCREMYIHYRMMYNSRLHSHA